MIKEITMPAGGQTTDMSTVGTWLVNTGDQVKRGDPLLEIETDKATLVVESFAKGTVLAILVSEGDQASAGDVIAYIGEQSDIPEVQSRLAGEDKPEKIEGRGTAMDTENIVSEEDEYQPIDKLAPVRYADGKENAEDGKDLPEIKAMPNAKLAAKEQNVSLLEVARYTRKSRLNRQDVETYARNQMDVKEESVKENVADTGIPLTTMRKVIARRMLESSQNIPAFQITAEVDMSQCIAFRELANGQCKDLKISYNDILFKCTEAAIYHFPYVNASYTEEEIILHRDVNIGLAVSVEEGLVVPVVRDVKHKSITEISKINRENIKKARDGKLSMDEMTGGTITISNLGMYPVTSLQAIINPPEVCILALGATKQKPVLVENEWKAVPMMNITGSFDHRVIDGAYGAQFLTKLKQLIENPALALL